MRIRIINGPNLNLTGSREPHHYGKKSFEKWIQETQHKYANQEVSYFQSNNEGLLIDEIQNAAQQYDAVILNAGGYAHSSIALADAVRALNIPVIEVHLSNVFARESYRHHSFLTPYCQGLICGLGLAGYDMAIHYLIQDKS